MRNRRFVRRLDTTLRKIENPRTVMREPVKKTPPAKRDVFKKLHQSDDDVRAGDRAVQEGGH